jgi:small conductance mechanosensitive channel
MRTTKLEDSDGNDVTLPNSEVVSKRIVNYTRTPRVRIRIPVGIDYRADLAAARACLLSCAGGDDRLLATPAPAVVVRELAESSVKVELHLWVADPERRQAIRSEYLERAKRALEAGGISIPFPQREVRLIQPAGARG